MRKDVRETDKSNWKRIKYFEKQIWKGDVRKSQRCRRESIQGEISVGLPRLGKVDAAQLILVTTH